MRDDNITRRPRPGQQNGRHNNNRSAHANTATTPTSTTQMEAYVPVTHAPSMTTAAATAAATSTSFATPSCPSSPPAGIGYSFIAAPQINIAAQPVEFSMTADSGASSHFIDNQLLPGIEHKMNHYVQLDPPVTTKVAGNHRLYGVGQGVLFVQVLDHIGSKHSVRLPVTVVPGLGRHLFSGGSAAARGVTMIIATKSYLDMGAFAIPLRKDSNCSSLYHLDLTTCATSRTHETAFPNISGKNFKPKTVLAVHASTTPKATSLPKTVPANIWHKKRLGHPNGQVMAKVKNIAECGVKFSDTLSACETCKINKITQQKHLKTSRPDPSSERLKLVSTDLLGPVTPKAIGGYAYMAKYTDHHSRLKAVYFIEKKSDTLHTLGRFIQDLAIPLGLRVQHLRSDNGGEYTSGSFQKYCKTTVIRQQFSAPYTPQQNGVSERDGRTNMDMTRCLLSEAHLPKTSWGVVASTAVFLINRLPHAAIGGDTPYHRIANTSRPLARSVS